MRHRRRTRRLGCKTAHRKAMLGNMVTSLLQHGRIVTTVPRAKEVRRVADKMVTLAKRSSLHSRRQAFSVIRDRKVVSKLFDKWGQEFADRNGGYTRIVRIGPRRGDAAMMSIVELVTDSLEKPKPQRKPQKIVSAESVIPQAAPLEPSKTSEADVGSKEGEVQEEEKGLEADKA
ncbi:MAG: 50S ribosomal protein L17 [Thermodesulfobacteriota bacterium]|nr:50S ribosomal protein L17 [Thermodesulfobacteriota bacterium]